MHSRSRTEYSVLNIITGMGGYVVNTVLGFVCRMIFVRCLSAEYLGINGLFTNIFALLSLAELGVGNAIVFALYKPLAENDTCKVASLMRIYAKAYKTIGAIVFLAGLAVMPFLNLIIKEKPNITESLYILYFIQLFNAAGSYFFSYKTTLIIANQRNYIVGGINYLVTIIASILQMVFLLIYKNYLGYLLIQTAGTFIYNIVISVIATKMFPYIRQKDVKPLPKSERRALFTNIRDLMINKFSSLLVNGTDNVLIAFFTGLASTGIASNYTLLINTLNSLLSQIFNGLTASIGNHNVSESKEKRFEMFGFLNMMNFWIFGWAALGIFFCSSDLVQLCFGEAYVLPREIPFVMALNFFTVGMMNAVWTYKHTLGLFRYGRFVQMITGAFNIMFSVILGSYWGIFGILIATTFARLCTNLWYDPYAVFIHGFGKSPVLYAKKIVKYVVVLLIAAVLCRVSFLVIRGPHIVQTLLKILLCSLICNGVFFVVFRKTPEFEMLKSYVQQIFNKIFHRKK